MNAFKKWGAALLLAAMPAAFGGALPVQAAPEATPDSFAPGARVDTLAPLKLKAKGAGKALQGTVVWDGSRIDASVRTEQGRIRDASLKGELTIGNMGMFLSWREEKGLVPAVAENDGAVSSLLDRTPDESTEAAVNAIGDWADQGKKALKLLFLPEKAFKEACAHAKAQPKAPLGAILKPYAGETGCCLTLFRKDDSFVLHLGKVETVGEWLKIGR